jgi:hypothetical protein
LKGWEKQKAEEQLLDINEDIADLPENDLLEELCEAEDRALLKVQEKFEKRSFKSSGLFQKLSNTFGTNSEQAELIKQFVVQCRDEFIAEKKRVAEEKVRETVIVGKCEAIIRQFCLHYTVCFVPKGKNGNENNGSNYGQLDWSYKKIYV